MQKSKALASTLRVKVHPRARKNEITGRVGDMLKVSLMSPAIEGRANQACIEFFADVLNVPRSSVIIVSGKSARIKVIRMADLSSDELDRRLNLLK